MADHNLRAFEKLCQQHILLGERHTKQTLVPEWASTAHNVTEAARAEVAALLTAYRSLSEKHMLAVQHIEAARLALGADRG
jgi:hypothetical protein